MVKKANEESEIQPVVSLIGNKSENSTYKMLKYTFEKKCTNFSVPKT